MYPLNSLYLMYYFQQIFLISVEYWAVYNYVYFCFLSMLTFLHIFQTFNLYTDLYDQ